MQTCQQQLVQPRLSSFVSDHLEHIYNSIGKISTGVCPEVEKIGGEGQRIFSKVCVKYRPKKNKLSENRGGGDYPSPLEPVGSDPDPLGFGSGSELLRFGSALGLENFADRTRSKKILVQIIIFFEFFLIIDNVKAIKHKTNDIKCVNLFI
jgi:hypothetical protein